MKAPRIVTVTLNPAIDQTVQVPGLQMGRVNKAHGMRFDAGGKGVNVASVLADLGLACAATGLLGEDNASLFEDHFAARGIEDHFIRTPGSTRINVKLNDPDSGETTDINLAAATPDAGSLAQLATTLTDLTHTAARIFVLSGSLPPGVAATLYADLIGMLKAAGKKVVLDTSGAPFAAALAARPDFVKPNRHELEAWLGRALPDLPAVVAGAQELQQAGPAEVLVSLGEEGALLLTPQGVWHAAGQRVAVVSTVGAGDAMVAGWIAGALNAAAPDEILKTAVASATARVCSPDGSLHRAGLAELVRAIEVVRL